MTANIVVVLVFDPGARRFTGPASWQSRLGFPLACAERLRTQNERRGKAAPLLFEL
jgi:hypothetical protein